MITKKEGKQLVKWVLIYIFSIFVALELHNIILPYLPTPIHRIIAGIIGLLAIAYFFDLTKYGG